MCYNFSFTLISHVNGRFRVGKSFWDLSFGGRGKKSTGVLIRLSVWWLVFAVMDHLPQSWSGPQSPSRLAPKRTRGPISYSGTYFWGWRGDFVDDAEDNRKHKAHSTGIMFDYLSYDTLNGYDYDTIQDSVHSNCLMKLYFYDLEYYSLVMMFYMQTATSIALSMPFVVPGSSIWTGNVRLVLSYFRPLHRPVVTSPSSSSASLPFHSAVIRTPAGMEKTENYYKKFFPEKLNRKYTVSVHRSCMCMCMAGGGQRCVGLGRCGNEEDLIYKQKFIIENLYLIVASYEWVCAYIYRKWWYRFICILK